MSESKVHIKAAQSEPGRENFEPGEIFVGRQKELDRLRELLQQAARGTGSFVLIHGEAGIGKNSLVSAFASSIQDPDVICVMENYRRTMDFEPYAPFVRLVQKLSSAGRQCNAAQEETGMLLHSAHGESAGKGEGWDAESLFQLQTRHRLVQQRLLSSLLAAALEKTLVVAFFDFHLAPKSTWQFLHYLSESLQDHKLMVLVTLRYDGRRRKQHEIPVYHDILQRMNRERLIEKIKLARFQEADIRKLLYRTFRRTDFSNDFIPNMLEVTGGVPARIHSCLHKMIRHGIVYCTKGVWFNDESADRDALFRLASEEASIHETVQHFHELESAEQELLRYAACMKDVLDARYMAELLQVPRLKVLKRLESLRELNYLISYEDEYYKFKRPEIRLAVLRTMTPAELHDRHLKIAHAIESCGDSETSQGIFYLSYHYSRANQVNKALTYVIQAMELSIRNFAFQEALAYLEQAAQFIEDNPDVLEPDSLLQFYIKAGWLQRVLGNWQASLAFLRKALSLNNGKDQSKSRVQILTQKGLTFFRLNDWENAERCLQACIEERLDAGKFDRAMAHYGLGNVLFEISKFDLAQEMFEKALALARELEAHQLIANIYNNMGAVSNALGRRLKAISCYSQSIPLFQKLGDDFGLARVYNNIGMTHADEQNWEEANKFYGKSLAITDALGIMHLKAITFLNRAYALAHLKKYDDAAEYNYKACRLLMRMQDELGLAEYNKIQGFIERVRGNLDSSHRHLEEALRLFNRLDNRLGSAETEYEMACLCMDAGEPAAALDWFARAGQAFRELGNAKKAADIEQVIEQSRRQQQAESHLLRRPSADFHATNN